MAIINQNDALLPASLQIDAQDKLTFAPEFQTMLNQIANAVNHASKLATIQSSNDLSQLDESDLEVTINDLSQAQSVARNVTKIRRELKKYLRGRTNNIIDQFDQAVNAAHYPELANYDAQAKTLKKELSAFRINQRWEQLKTTFEANVDNYPIIKQLAPSLTNFDLFKMRHPKLVTGAKSWKFGDKQMTAINQDLYNMNNCLQDLQNNSNDLQPAYKNAILNGFIANPDPTQYYQLKDQIREKQQSDIALAQQRAKEAEQRRQMQEKEAELRKQAEEKARLATQAHLAAQQAQTEAQKQQLEQQSNQYSQQAMNVSSNLQQVLAQKAQEAAKASQAQQQQQSQTDKVRSWLSNLVMANITKYGNLATDNRQKVRLLYDLMHALDNPSSRFNEFLNTAKDINEKNELIVITMTQVATV